MVGRNPEGHEEIYALHEAVSNRETFGPWRVTTDGDRTFIEGSLSTLALVSEKARVAFRQKVRELTGESEPFDIETWYGFERNMANPRA